MSSKQKEEISQKTIAREQIKQKYGTLPKAINELYQKIKFYENEDPLDKYTNDVMRALIDYKRNFSLYNSI